MKARAHLRLVASSEAHADDVAPPVAAVKRDAANDRLPPDFAGFAPRGEAMSPAAAARAGSRSIWAVALASAAAHAALVAAFAMVMSPPGLEARTDAVSVEIVVEVAPVAQESSTAAGAPGMPATVEAERVDTEPAVAAAVETAEVVPPQAAEAVAAEPAEVAPTEAVAPEMARPAQTEPAEPTEPAAAAEVPEAAAESAAFVPSETTPALPETSPAAAAPDQAAPVDVAPVDTAPVDVAPLDAAIVRPGPAPVLAETPPVFAAEPAHPVLQAPPRNDVAAALLAPPPAFPPAEETPTLPASTDAVPLPRPAPPGAAAKPVAQARRPERPAKPSKPAAAAKKPVSSATEAAPRKSAKAKAAPALRSATQPKGKAAAKPAMAGGAQGGGGSGARAAAGPGVEAAYAKKLFSHLARRQRYPAAAERARVTGTVRLSIAIDRSGGLAAARVAKGSGHAVLDAEALATARRASPYPKPPEGVGGKTYGFAVTLRFDRKR